MVLKPYPSCLAMGEHSVPEFLYGRVRSVRAEYCRLNAEVAQVFESRECLVAEEGGHLFKEWEECCAAISRKAHAKCVRYACVDVSYSDEFYAWVIRQKDMRGNPIR
jgi:hypothetical protein